MSQLRSINSYPMRGNLDPYACAPFCSYPITRNLDPLGSYPIRGNLDPFGDAAGLIGGALDSLTGGLFNNVFGGAKSTPSTVVVNEAPPQPAPPTPFNWTPVIVSAGFVLVAMTLIMTTSKK